MPTPTHFSIVPNSTPICDTWVGPTNDISVDVQPRSPVKKPARVKSAATRLMGRPKSTPVKVRFQPPPTDVRDVRRPKTAAVMTGCERVQQVEQEPTRRQALEPHLAARKTRTPPWQRELDPPMTSTQLGPGFVMSRSKAKVNVTINSDDFLDQVADQRRAVKGDPERDQLISQLQDQINELQFLLEEERLGHKLTQQRADEVLNENVKNLQQQHEQLTQQLMQDHQASLDEHRRLHDDEIESLKDMYDQQLDKTRQELELVQGAFQTYKTQLHIDFDERWKRTQLELRKAFDQEKEEAIEEEKKQAQRQRGHEKTQLLKEHNVKLLQKDKEHKREIEALNRRFSSSASEIKDLQQKVKELQETEELYTDLKERFERLQKLQNETQQSLADTQVELSEFEKSFNARVRDVDEQYRQKIHDLMEQNTDLRRQYMKKCRDLFDEKADNEFAMAQRIKEAKSTMEAVINARTRAEVSLAPCDPEADKMPRVPCERPLSAPLTRVEEIRAQRQAGETGHLNRHKLEVMKPKSAKPVKPVA